MGAIADETWADIAAMEMEMSKCTASTPHSLCDYPSELIGLIAERLDRKDLNALRCVRNRYISKAIDHVWADAHFSCLECKTANGPSLGRLTNVACSRFAKRIRTIEISFQLECGPERYSAANTPCMAAMLGPAMRHALMTTLPAAVGLRKIIIRAPVAVEGVHDEFLDTMLSDFGDARPFPDLYFATHYEHEHIIDTVSMHGLFTTIIHTIRNHLAHSIQEFEVVGFANTNWASALVPTERVYTNMLSMSTLQNMTILDLQFEMFAYCSSDVVAAVVKAIENNASLRVLKLRAGPRSTWHFAERSEYWAPLLQLLGTDPPFRLHTLEISGLVTSTEAPTLDRIIDVHASALRRVVFEHLNFHTPNTLRAFYKSLADTDINYFSTNRFLFHERYYLVCGSIQYTELSDEVLQWDDDDSEDEEGGKDESYKNWTDVRWLLYRRGTPMTYENVDGSRGEDYMRGRFLAMVRYIDDGAINDGP